MKAIVGLGNPGKKYRLTRHNLGRMLVERLSQRWGASPFKSRREYDLFLAEFEGRKVGLVLPKTFMNLSGVAVRAFRDLTGSRLEEMLVVCDDANLPLGRVRLRPAGGDGGHKGLRSIVEFLGTEEFPRLRMGIGAPPESYDLVEFVLSPFCSDEWTVVEEMLERACEVVEEWIRAGIERAMSLYNR